MSNPMKRHYKPQTDTNYSHDVHANAAGWKCLSFSVLSLETNRVIQDDTDDEEILIVPLTGYAVVAYANQSHRVGRTDLFGELTDIIYLPPHTDFSISAAENVEIAIGRAPAAGKKPPRLIRREELESFVRGGTNVERGVNILLNSPDISERLIAFEIRPPSGNWSSFPPHRHDTREGSSYHEETYYYRLTPVDGFALQRIYTRDTDLDVTVAASDRDLVLVHEGYHAVVNAPGTNAYYLNFLAGDEHRMRPVTDPHYDWVNRQWDGKPISIPVRGSRNS